MLKVGFIGAGAKAQGTHYPCVNRLDNVSIEAVAEMDESQMKQVVEKYNIPNSFLCKSEDDYERMLESVELDAVYVIMEPYFMIEPVVRCMNAGKHVFIEKPAGGNIRETTQLLNAAIANEVYCMVGYQLRYADVTKEAMRLVRERGPATFAMVEFHKPSDFSKDNMSALWSDICQATDLIRYMIGSESLKVTTYQDDFPNGRKNCFNGLIRFANSAVGIVTGCRHSGGKYLRAELHGLGVGCYFRLPKKIEILLDGSERKVLSGAEIQNKDPNDVASYEGVLTMHQHFVDCIYNGEIPCSDIRDIIHTSHLVDQLPIYWKKRSRKRRRRIGEVHVVFLHPVNASKMSVTIDDTMTAEEAIDELVFNDFIKPSEGGYFLAIKGGNPFESKQSFADAGVKDGDTIRVIPNIRA